MNHSSARWRGWLWWLIPVSALVVVLGIETDFGQALHRLPGPPPNVDPTPVTIALLPEYRVEGGLAAHSETVSRTLFNATRRAAPALPSTGGRGQLQRGQYVLTGTAVAGERHIAFLKEVPGGKSRVVRQGEQINGVLVADVKADRVKLTLGDESEELILKVAAGPKTTTVPPPAPAQAPTLGGVAPMPGGAAQGNVPAPEATPASLPERRRAAAAAAAAAAPAAAPATTPSGTTAQAAPAPAPAGAAPGPPASTDPAWNDVYERMRQRGAPAQPSK
jgi:hypothetical protein